MTESEWNKRLPDVAVGDRIPRILHQTYGSRTLPELLQANVDSLKAMNPEWEHRLYDDSAIEAFIAEHYGDAVLARYRKIDPDYGAARADLFRYLLIYRLGGVYLDIKSRFERPIDEVIRPEDAFIVAQWSNGPGEVYENFGRHPDLADIERGEIQQWHVISAPGHPFLRAVVARVLANIDRYRPWNMGVGRIGVLRLTGPIAYTRAIHPLLRRYPCRIVRDEREVGLQYSIAGNYVHAEAFPRPHYSLLEKPVVTLPAYAHPLALAYVWARRLRKRLKGEQAG